MKLIVKKGDVEELSQAEKRAILRESKKAGQKASGKSQKVAGGSGIILRTRVERNMDGSDKNSIGNRLSKQLKKDFELFPGT